MMTAQEKNWYFSDGFEAEIKNLKFELTQTSVT